MKVTSQLLTDFDIEDVVHSQAISQCRLLQMMNIGREIDANASLPREVLPTIFRNNEEELTNG